MASEFSAGGVVFNAVREVVVIVPTRRAADGSRVLALPKGHPDGAESPAEAALREVREEAGVEAELVESLGQVRYWYQRGGRRIASPASHQARSAQLRNRLPSPVAEPAIRRLFSISRWRSFNRSNAASSFM